MVFFSFSECSGDADLLFIIDRSGSIPHEYFNALKEFIVSLAGRFELWKEKVRLAALAFHDDAEIIFDFNSFKNIRNVEEVPIWIFRGKLNLMNTFCLCLIDPPIAIF